MNRMNLDLFWNEVRKFVTPYYNEKHRHYHTINHVDYLLEQLDKYEVKNSSVLYAIKLAIYFHDIVYDVKSNSNEKDSAKLYFNYLIDSNEFKPKLKSNLPVEINNNVFKLASKYILASDHKTDIKSLFLQIDEYNGAELFLWLDMKILAEDRDKYKIYINQIRKEYFCFSDEEYNKGRSKFLIDTKEKIKDLKLIYDNNIICQKQMLENINYELKLL